MMKCHYKIKLVVERSTFKMIAERSTDIVMKECTGQPRKNIYLSLACFTMAMRCDGDRGQEP